MKTARLAHGLALGTLLLAALPAVASTSIVGQVATNDVRIDGALVPAGTTLFSGSGVATAEDTAVVHLSNGRTVALDKNSRASFTTAGDGDIVFSVEQGRAVFAGLGGEPIMLLASRTLLLQDEPAAGEEMTVDLCTLNEDGDWELMAYPASREQERLAAGDVVPGDNDLGLDKNCEEEKGGFWAGLSGAEKAAIVAAGVAGLVLVDEIIEDDEASP